MKIVDTANYNALVSGGWCYSTDGVRVQAANSYWEKVLYLGRAIFFCNGTHKTLKNAIICSFSPLDQALIRAKLTNLKEVKNDRMAGTSLASGRSIEIAKLAEEAFPKIPNDAFLNPQPGIELSTDQIAQWGKIYTVFAKIHVLAEELTSGETPTQLKAVMDKISESKKMEEFRKLHKCYPSLNKFQERFILNQDEASDFLKRYHARETPKSLDDPTKALEFHMQSLVDELKRMNCFAKESEKFLQGDNDCKMFQKAFLEHQRSVKDKLFRLTLIKVFVPESYTRIGPDYVRAITFECVPFWPQIMLNEQDYADFMVCYKNHIEICQKWHLACRTATTGSLEEIGQLLGRIVSPNQ